MSERKVHDRTCGGRGSVNLPSSRNAWVLSINLVFFCAWVAGCASSDVVVSNSSALTSLHRVAVLPFRDAPGADAGDSGKAVASVIASFALDVPAWTVVEREQLIRVIEEQDMAVTDNLVDPKTAVEVGKLVGADSVIVGQVMQYRIGSIPFLFLFTFDMDLYKVEYSFRLVSVQTGEWCLSARTSKTSAASFEQAISDGATEIFEKIGTALNTGSDEHTTRKSGGKASRR